MSKYVVAGTTVTFNASDISGSVARAELVINAAEVDTTDFGSNGVEREPTGIADYTGSFSGQFPVTDTSTGGAVASQQVAIVEQSASTGTITSNLWKLIESSKSMYFGNILISDYS